MSLAVTAMNIVLDFITPAIVFIAIVMSFVATMKRSPLLDRVVAFMFFANSMFSLASAIGHVVVMDVAGLTVGFMAAPVYAILAYWYIIMARRLERS